MRNHRVSSRCCCCCCCCQARRFFCARRGSLQPRRSPSRRLSEGLCVRYGPHRDEMTGRPGEPWEPWEREFQPEYRHAMPCHAGSASAAGSGQWAVEWAAGSGHGAARTRRGLIRPNGTDGERRPANGERRRAKAKATRRGCRGQLSALQALTSAVRRSHAVGQHPGGGSK